MASRQRTYHVRIIDRATDSLYACSVRVSHPSRKGFRITTNPTPALFVSVRTITDDEARAAFQRCQLRLARLGSLLGQRLFKREDRDGK